MGCLILMAPSFFDALYIYAAINQTTENLNISEQFHLRLAPSSRYITAFAGGLGYTGVLGSTTVYLNTQMNTSSGSPHFTPDWAHVSVWSDTSAGRGGPVARPWA